MNAHRPLTLRILKDLHAIKRIRMHRAHNAPRIIRPNGNQAQIKGTPELSNLLERGTMRQVCELRAVIVSAPGQVRHRAVASVAAEPDASAARGDGPGGPEGVIFVEGGARGGVLAGEAGDACGYVVAGGRGGGGDGDALFARGGGREGYVYVLPPVEFDGVADAAFLEPFFEAQWYGKEDIRMCFLDL